MKSEIAIRTVGLTKRYKDLTAVDTLNMEIGKGELFSLLGVNGAGKTTTVRMLSTLAAPTSGEAYLMGHSITEEPQAVKRLIAVSPQETAVAPGLTVRENLELMLGIHGTTGGAAKEKAEEISLRLGLGQVMKRRAGRLSGGWQRRLSIAMALVSDPEVIFLDEPTLGLDVIVRSELWELIRGLKANGKTIVLTTHYLEEALALSDRIGIMCKGRLAIAGTADSIIKESGVSTFEEAFIHIAREEKI